MIPALPIAQPVRGWSMLGVTGRAVHREWCARVFAPALTGQTGAARQRRLAQLTAVCDVHTWKLLRLDAGEPPADRDRHGRTTQPDDGRPLMARILAYTSPARGHLYPLTPILDELAARGHDIAVRTLACEVALMTRHGFAAAPISDQVEAITLQDWRGRNPRHALEIAVRGFGARAEHDAADLRRAIDQEQPDAVVVDVNSWGALAAAERWGGPWAALCPYPLALLPGRTALRPGPGPRPGPGGRIRDRLLRPLVLGAVQSTMLPPLNAVRTQAASGRCATPTTSSARRR